jgi:L-2-hydroxyglutarate oxidase LhgO
VATAFQLSRVRPDLKVVILEKEAELAAHQTGHNSGVLHSGIYYRPGSLKARNCREGKRAMEQFCAEEGIPFEICGKVIVAVDAEELPRLEQIFQRGQQNGVQCELIGPERLRELEPHAAGVRAVHVPEAGIVDFRCVCRRLAELVAGRGGEIFLGQRVHGIVQREARIRIQTSHTEFEVGYLVNCAGLHSDRVTAMSGQDPASKVVPFRGEYYELKPERQHLCRNLIYPVPDPSFPFLGVHFTRMIQGGVECGPNAVLAFAREGYRKRDINLHDLTETLTYPGFLRLASRYWRVGAGEMWRSFSKAAFVRALQRLMPEVRSSDLVPGRAGVRAQALGRDGALIDDFVIQPCGRVINVGNAPSPAATSSLQIGETVVEQLQRAM